MLAIALGIPKAKGKPPAGRMPSDEDPDPDGDGDDDRYPETDADDGEEDGSIESDDAADDPHEDAMAAAGDLMDSLRSRDPSGVLDAFRALMKACEAYGDDDVGDESSDHADRGLHGGDY